MSYIVEQTPSSGTMYIGTMYIVHRSTAWSLIAEKPKLGEQRFWLHKPVTDWLETLPHSSDGLNM